MDERSRVNHPNRLAHVVEAVVALYGIFIVATALASIAR